MYIFKRNLYIWVSLNIKNIQMTYSHWFTSADGKVKAYVPSECLVDDSEVKGAMRMTLAEKIATSNDTEQVGLAIDNGLHPLTDKEYFEMSEEARDAYAAEVIEQQRIYRNKQAARNTLAARINRFVLSIFNI